MKFTKEQALAQIKAILGDATKGQAQYVSDRSINEMLDNLMPIVASDETELTDFITKVTPMFNTANLNVKNDTTEGIKKYKDANPITPPTPQVPPAVPPATPPIEQPKALTVEDIAKIVAEANKPFIEKLSAIEGEKAKATLLEQAKVKFNEFKPDTQRQAIIDKAFKSVQNGDYKTPEELANAWKSEYDELVSLAGIQSGYVPAEGSGGANTDADMKAEVDRLKKEGILT